MCAAPGRPAAAPSEPTPCCGYPIRRCHSGGAADAAVHPDHAQEVERVHRGVDVFEAVELAREARVDRRLDDVLALGPALARAGLSGVKVIDPVDPKRPLVFAGKLARDAQALGTALVGHLVEKAIWVPVSDFAATVVSRYVGASRAYDTAMN